MNCHSQFLAQTDLGELLGKKPACFSQKEILLLKERVPLQRDWDRGTVRKGYVANIRKASQRKHSMFCSINHPELKGVRF